VRMTLLVLLLALLSGMAMGQDVPAIKVGSHLAAICGGKYDSVAVCMDGQVEDYSCADKSNVLLTAEDGEKWCHACRRKARRSGLSRTSETGIGLTWARMSSLSMQTS
jgi:hypothetical protein